MVKMNRVIIGLLAFGAASSFPAFDYDTTACGSGSSAGVCIAAGDCPSAMSAIRTRHSHGLPRCGLEGSTEIVCCPDADLRSPLGNARTSTEWVWGMAESTTSRIKNELRGSTRKSALACEEYMNELPLSIQPQIFGGVDADLGEFPHMAALGYETFDGPNLRWECGGSLISSRYVLTAAHCLIKQDGTKPVRVRLGIVNLKDESVTRQDYRVANLSVHPDYQIRSKFNDVALIRLSSPVKYTREVQPACLYDKSDDPKNLVATGWGYINQTTVSDVLQKVVVQPVALNKCNDSYQNTFKTVTRSQICAGSDDGSRDACQGDSGGPLQVQKKDTSIHSIVGVTSYGIGCGGKHPGIYTRVFSHLDWIERIVWP